ncbi:hypothetical protein R1sor_014259 [Riccia sorocarpa]|uniref:SMP domain-containing protein n=1 Tax=Riccia sorocarpa TaxID=122646 RepID=A0ABD3HCN3_9MARC
MSSAQEMRPADIAASAGVDQDVAPVAISLVTIGEALETVASKIGDKPLTTSDARAIQSAENASAHLHQDKVVTPRDAAMVHSAEARNNDGRVQKGGVASTMHQVTAHNETIGLSTGGSV